jgi:ferritin-like metal-binding protein YciE
MSEFLTSFRDANLASSSRRFRNFYFAALAHESSAPVKPSKPPAATKVWPGEFRGGNMANEGLRDLYIDELKDMYNAENQLVKALPKMAKAASSDELRQGFEQHLEQTRGHVQRLEQIFKSLDESPKGKKCAGMEGLVKEGSEVMEEEFEGALMDAALIGAAQRVEHYEIAAYGTASEFAKILGESEHVRLLEETLQEEKETDEKLTELAKEINPQANEGARESEETKSTSKRSRRAA